jgi:hypothetical protein
MHGSMYCVVAHVRDLHRGLRRCRIALRSPAIDRSSCRWWKWSSTAAPALVVMAATRRPEWQLVPPERRSVVLSPCRIDVMSDGDLACRRLAKRFRCYESEDGMVSSFRVLCRF